MQQSPLHTANNKFGSLILSNASTPSQKQQTSNEKAFHFSHNQYIRPSLDSQLSTSSGSPNMSPLHSRTGSYHDTGDFLDQPNARFPILVQNKFAKLQTKLKASKRREQEIKSADAPVNEEKEESEKEIHFLKKLPVVEDAEEFNVKKTHLNRLRGRDMFNRELSRCKSTEASFFLDSVQEDKEEDDFNLFKQRKKIDEWNMEDHNEFNQNDRSATERKPRRKYSLQFGPQESIQEEQEKILIPHFQSLFSTPHTGSNSSYHGSLHSSPGPKLRVDEIDFKDRKSKTKDEDDGEVIDPIMEETEERNMQVVDNKEYQAAKHKLNEEREFLKKVIKGEMIDENNSSFSKMNSERDYSYVGSGVIEEIIEEDRNESLQN